jgi:hypothetical protein
MQSDAHLNSFILEAPFVSLRNVNKYSLRNIALVILTAAVLACATYLVDLWFFSHKVPHLNPNMSPSDASFLEGIPFVLCGALALIGSGGISRGTEREVITAAEASVINKDVIGPSEIFRREAWKPKGFTRLGLTLIIAGIILIIVGIPQI